MCVFPLCFVHSQFIGLLTPAFTFDVTDLPLGLFITTNALPSQVIMIIRFIPYAGAFGNVNDFIVFPYQIRANNSVIDLTTDDVPNNTNEENLVVENPNPEVIVIDDEIIMNEPVLNENIDLEIDNTEPAGNEITPNDNASTAEENHAICKKEMDIDNISTIEAEIATARVAEEMMPPQENVDAEFINALHNIEFDEELMETMVDDIDLDLFT